MSTRVPAEAVRPLTVRVFPSTSAALPISSAVVITRRPLSSAIGARVTGVVVGASLTGVRSRVALPATVRGSAVPLVVPLSVMV